MNTYVVTTQFLENYGTSYKEGAPRWKFKGGTDYIVSGLEREQDAVAYVAALCMQNNIQVKEFPISWTTYDEWLSNLPNDEEYRKFIMQTAVEVNPNKESMAA